MGLSFVPVRESLVSSQAESSQAETLSELTIASAAPARGDNSKLLQAIIRLRKLSPGTGIGIGFTGVRRGAGTSYTLEGVAKDLTRHSGESVLTTASRPFSEPFEDEMERPATAIQHGKAGLATRRSEPGDKNSDSNGSNGSWLKNARERFSYVLVDCPPPGISSEILSLGPSLAGIVLVVSSGQASREEIRNAIGAIQSSGGMLIGLVLNRYRSALPWRQI